MVYAFGKEHLDWIESILGENLIDNGIHCVLLIDMAGHIIAQRDNGNTSLDVYSLAALAAGNFGVVNAMAKIVGEDEFTLLFHKGQNESIHFSKINSGFLLITIFGQEITLGLLRLKVAEAIEKIRDVWQV